MESPLPSRWMKQVVDAEGRLLRRAVEDWILRPCGHMIPAANDNAVTPRSRRQHRWQRIEIGANHARISTGSEREAQSMRLSPRPDRPPDEPNARSSLKRPMLALALPPQAGPRQQSR